MAAPGGQGGRGQDEGQPGPLQQHTQLSPEVAVLSHYRLGKTLGIGSFGKVTTIAGSAGQSAECVGLLLPPDSFGQYLPRDCDVQTYDI